MGRASQLCSSSSKLRTDSRMHTATSHPRVLHNISNLPLHPTGTSAVSSVLCTSYEEGGHSSHQHWQHSRPLNFLHFIFALFSAFYIYSIRFLIASHNHLFTCHSLHYYCSLNTDAHPHSSSQKATVLR